MTIFPISVLLSLSGAMVFNRLDHKMVRDASVSSGIFFGRCLTCALGAIVLPRTLPQRHFPAT
jgi:hypothetical protein